VSLSGRLEEHDLPEVLHFLALNNKTGKLVLTRRQGQGLIVVRRGRILYAVSSSVHETFGNILVRRGLVGDEALAAALERQHLASEPRRLGSVLVEMGRLTESQIEDVVRQQTTRVVQELCRWPSGFFKFETMAVEAAGAVEVDAQDFLVAGGISTDQVLIEAVTRLDESAPASPLREMASAGAPALRAEVTHRLLREAARLVSRGLLLVVRGDEAQGAGHFGFGEVGPPGRVEAAIEGLSVPLHQPSVFADVVERREVCRGPLAETAVNRRLAILLGGGTPDDAVVIPMLVRESVVVIFYGDNLPSGRPIGSTEDLEWAFVEASLEMEKEALDERIRAFDNAHSRRALALSRPPE
jgi:hypothetical protein